MPTQEQSSTVHEFVERATEQGIRNVRIDDPTVAAVYQDLIDAHGESFRVAFAASAVIAVIGAVASWILVRKESRTITRAALSRRSRWVAAGAGGTTSVPPTAVERASEPT